MISMALIINLGALLVVLFLLVLIVKFFKKPMLVVMNSVLGFIVFFVLNLVFHLGVPINFWTLAIVGLGGVGGVILVLLLHFLGMGF